MSIWNEILEPRLCFHTKFHKNKFLSGRCLHDLLRVNYTADRRNGNKIKTTNWGLCFEAGHWFWVFRRRKKYPIVLSYLTRSQTSSSEKQSKRKPMVGVDDTSCDTDLTVLNNADEAILDPNASSSRIHLQSWHNVNEALLLFYILHKIRVRACVRACVCVCVVVVVFAAAAVFNIYLCVIDRWQFLLLRATGHSCCCWSLLYSAILHSQADSVSSLSLLESGE